MGWYILAAILFLLVVILLVPVHAIVEWNKNLFIKIRFLFFRFSIIPNNKKKKKKSEPKKTDNTGKKEHKSSEKKKEKKSLEEIVDLITDLSKKYGPGVKMTFKTLRIHVMEGFWKITADDAAQCAIKYGRICASINSITAFFQNIIKIEKQKFRIYPDFASDEDEIRGRLDFQITPMFVIIGGIMLVVAYLKDKLNQK